MCVLVIIMSKWGLDPEEHAPSISKENSGRCGPVFPCGGFAPESLSGVSELCSGVDTIKDQSELSRGDNPVSRTEVFSLGTHQTDGIQITVFIPVSSHYTLG